MLVWYYLSKGMTAINGKRIYGYETGFPPTAISYQLYLDYKDILLEAPYTGQYLSHVFNKTFPDDIRFTLAELPFSSYKYIRDIARLLDLPLQLKHKGMIFKIREV